MKHFLGLVAISDILIVSSMMATPLLAQKKSSLFLAYPPPEHQTTAEKIFLIGTASPEAEVSVNGKAITNRSKMGHFAPSFPLKLGKNVFTLRHQNAELKITVIRNSAVPEIPTGIAFAEDSLTPAVNIDRLPEEFVCFGAIAPPKAEVNVSIGGKSIALLPQRAIALPPNSAVLTAEADTVNVAAGIYQGCTVFETSGNLGKPIFELDLQGKTVTKEGTGEITILDRAEIEVVEVTADEGVARTGASTDYSRLTPLPKGTRARVTGREGEWLRLDYGGWIKAEETKPVVGNTLPHSLIRGITSRQIAGATEIIFPLQTPVPVAVTQGEKQITLSLYNTTAQTDTIKVASDPVIQRLDWQQVTPTKIDYTFQLKNQQQWGYDLRYEGTNLIFTLRHSPQILPSSSFLSDRSLAGIEILLDPGHGGSESGSIGPTGYPEKKINLIMSQLVAAELKKMGATVYLTRETDTDLSLQERVDIINNTKPDLAISIHYNALPDSGDALNTQGISTFWYHPQAEDLASFLHSYLVENLNRPNYGVYWNNLALTRPHTAPAILLELGFMINPQEFEWITDAREQKKLAAAIAQGIKEWFGRVK
ncbi:N-acetylmuramoyl-L-alanine amidase [Myxosarcina sp. GI1]|uniref:N-acetylmuramoyl-L-alanine amidase n=1 Tax=Myxosarcina sp. GI1 TaxID=1541065 RepID=UPI00055D95B7|nr:N-acetylmuramoyl-L-alanine amidase [Myxosarcina sp. GI1]